MVFIILSSFISIFSTQRTGIRKMAKKPIKEKQKAKKSAGKSKPKVSASASTPNQGKVAQKNAFEANFGEGTAFDLDYGKLVIIALLVYVAYKVS
tara:strand:- start:186 stop:470 length:285 start_codon:yes stop_codon:yes gene_type:complete